jgi:hypothetical protein
MEWMNTKMALPSRGIKVELLTQRNEIVEGYYDYCHASDIDFVYYKNGLSCPILDVKSWRYKTVNE